MAANGSEKAFCVLTFHESRSLTIIVLMFVESQRVHIYSKCKVCNKNLECCSINPLNPELNPICYLLALLGGHHFLHVSRIRVKSLTLRLLMSYIYGAPILGVSRSHTTTQHSR